MDADWRERWRQLLESLAAIEKSPPKSYIELTPATLHLRAMPVHPVPMLAPSGSDGRARGAVRPRAYRERVAYGLQLVLLTALVAVFVWNLIIRDPSSPDLTALIGVVVTVLGITIPLTRSRLRGE